MYWAVAMLVMVSASLLSFMASVAIIIHLVWVSLCKVTLRLHCSRDAGVLETRGRRDLSLLVR